MKNTRYQDFKLAERGALISIWAYVVLSILKLVIANTTHSESLQADGFNNITDILGNIAVLIGLKIARRPADDDHTYGHWKVESVASLITSFIMFAVGFFVLKDTITAIINNEHTPVDLSGSIVGIFSAIVMLIIYFYNRNLALKSKSSSLMSAAKDNLSDAVSSIATSIAIFASSFNLTIIDRLMAVIITIFIFKTAYDIFAEAVFSLSDGFDETKISIYTAAIAKLPKVITVKFIRGRTYGSNIFLDVVVEMSPDLSVYESHEATEVIEKALKQDYDVFDVDVHVEPAILPDEARDASLALIILGLEEKVLNGSDPSLLSEYFTEIKANGVEIDKAQKLLEYHENLAIRGFKPDRISKKTFVITYHYFEKEQKFAVTSIWRRQTDWYCVSRQLTLIA
ncbi:cation diffusion facilitator family transporter [Lactococcus chungangensis]|jgi:cation diffusion facilitator family transporter|uniref:Cation diffusion facilitator family transporter n=2 Tax=Pseudolactococcus chungangensis TaxID=451457 RepID=A0A1K2H6K7_9LACT|nr:cation diffusion facilitator family transporter [Lactococcus chungangensis]NCB81968.1 cation transporter [Bacilli bacterium]NLH35567.1 cation transporter [Lactococcus chungangensis]PCS02900.1 cation transporter [Lactococcus chungangensis CAU 28 = DSM 22330]SFZ71953.1 cation diffusion facilitator family transporter [Lactococcus chungangensis CAU 28 = DSM 22330]